MAFQCPYIYGRDFFWSNGATKMLPGYPGPFWTPTITYSLSKNRLQVVQVTVYHQSISQSRLILATILTTSHHNCFTALFPRPPEWAGARRELVDFMVQGEIDRGRHTDHPAGRHSIRTKQCPPPPSPTFFTGRMPFLPPNQQCQSTKATILINTQLLTTYTQWMHRLG